MKPLTWPVGHAAPDPENWPTTVGDIHLQILQFAVMTSTLLLEFVGLIAGLPPAIKAARMSAMDALRYK